MANSENEGLARDALRGVLYLLIFQDKITLKERKQLVAVCTGVWVSKGLALWQSQGEQLSQRPPLARSIVADLLHHVLLVVITVCKPYNVNHIY